MYRLIIALALFATVSQALPTNATVRMATEGYVSNRVAVGMASAVAQAGTNAAALFGDKVSMTDAGYLGAVAHTNRTDNPHSVTAGQLGALTSEIDPTVAGAVTSHNTNLTTHATLFAGKLSTNDATYLDTVSKASTALQSEADSLALGRLTTHTNRVDNPHVVTAAQIGALTGEVDPTVDAKVATRVETNDVTYLATVSKANTAVQPAALSSYLPLAGGTMGRGADILFDEQYYTCQIGDLSGVFGIKYISIGVDLTLRIPDENGTVYVATREWSAGQYAPKAHTNDATAHASLFAGKVSTNDATYLNTVSKANTAVQTETDSLALGQLTTHTNRTDNPHTTTAAQVGGVPTSRTITVNGATGTLTSNLAFTVTGLTGTEVTNIVRTITHTSQTWGAPGTNATYRMSWDLTNMTFKVEEILP